MSPRPYLHESKQALRMQPRWLSCLALEEEFEKHLPNFNTVVFITGPIQCIHGLLSSEQSRFRPCFDHISSDELSELGMSLDRDKSPWDVHSLHGATRGGAKGNDIGRIVIDDVLMHLMDALQQLATVAFPQGMKKRRVGATYKLILPKQLLSPLGQIHL